MTADLDQRSVTLVAQFGTVKNWALDKGDPDVLALYRQAHAKWKAANTLLQHYRMDLEKKGRAE
eukprot:3265452-Prorocentrum_lima.AAC.1